MTRRTIRGGAYFLALFFLAAIPLSAAEYGDLTGRFVYDGKPPKRKKLSTRTEYCTAKAPFDQSLVSLCANITEVLQFWISTRIIHGRRG